MGYQQVADTRWAFGVGTMMRYPAGSANARQQAMPASLPPAGTPDTNRAMLAGLVVRMAASDERALAEFYDATLGKAYGLTLRLVRHAGLAEEVVSDAYHQVWREAARYDAARGAPLTWLLMICRSRALDALRARDSAVLHEAPETLVPEADQPRDEDPLDLITATRSRRAVHEALTSLAPVQRQMIGLAFFRGLTHQEIADETEVPLGTVKSQIRRALEALRGVLGAELGA